MSRGVGAVESGVKHCGAASTTYALRSLSRGPRSVGQLSPSDGLLLRHWSCNHSHGYEVPYS